MNAAPTKRSAWQTLTVVCRLTVGAVFIFSGLTKIIDPYGTALKTAEYLGAMGLGFAIPASEPLAIMQIVAELTLGILLATRLLRRMATFATFAIMVFFTLLTLWLAVWNPIEDCGCFGDIVVLTNWQTFFKNLVILPLSAVAWLGSRKECVLFPKSVVQWVATVVIAASVAIVALWNLTMLPLVDLSPLKVGTDLRISGEERSAGRAQVVCRNRLSGREQTFELDDPAWWDESEWEFVETLVEGGRSNRVRVTAADFALFDAHGDATDEVVDYRGTTEMLCIQSLDELDPETAERFERFAAEALAKGRRVIMVTASELPSECRLGSMELACYNMDITALQVLLRADRGVVTVTDGVITEKRSESEL